MVILGWIHPISGRRVKLTDLDDWPTRLIPAPVLRSIVAQEQEDERHRGDAITVTSGLNCPRRTFIARALNVYVDPSRLWGAHRGSLLHSVVGQYCDTSEWWWERHEPEKCTFSGKLFGIELSCRVDMLRKDYSELWDFKFQAVAASKHLPPLGQLETARPEHCAQLNMCRLLIGQATGRDVSNMRMTVWVDAGRWVPMTVPIMSEDEIGMVRVAGSNFTVLDIFRTLEQAMKEWRSGVPPEQVAKNLPMMGTEMYVRRSKSGERTGQCMCNLYCELEEECATLGGGSALTPVTTQ